MITSKPFRPNQRREQVGEQKQHDQRGENNHRSHLFAAEQEGEENRHRQDAQEQQGRNPDPKIHELSSALRVKPDKASKACAACDASSKAFAHKHFA
jgi:hypothetical protein